MKCGIVAIGYNRSFTLERLLTRLNQVDYHNDDVLLIISIDKSDADDVYRAADAFQWKHGQCIRKYHKMNMGLRNHILQCGSYIDEYDLDALAVFEDDIYPSIGFYNYMRQAVQYYQDSKQIAGISLYTFLWNAAAQLPFQPAYSEYDTFFIQYAQSWGQIWLRNQWREFMGWYEIYQGKLSELSGIPDNVCDWPETSWLKYHIAYCVNQHKYFVYPYVALSTCFNEAGTHTKQHCNIFQVPLVEDANKKYSFQPAEMVKVSYDVYFEREQVAEWLGMRSNELQIDLYGQKKKNDERRYWLTTQKYPYKVEKAFRFEMRPHEMNVLEKIPGDDIVLYDTQEPSKDSLRVPEIDQKMVYYFRIIRSKVWFIKYGLVNGIKKLMAVIQGR